MANPIRKLVQLVLDRNAADKTERDAKRALGGVDKAMQSLKRAAISLGSALAAAFAIRKIIQFGRETIRVAAEAEAIWNRLGQAVENVGVSFAEARPEVEAYARAMQDVTTVGDEDFAQVLTELITTTGDYTRSLRNVGVVADLAAAKQIDLRTAAQLVGRAMVGQTSTLTRYGIIVKEGEDAVEVLRRTFRGFAENEAKSLEGRLKRLNNEWSDFKQAVGETLMLISGGEETIQSLTTLLQIMAEWVTANRDLWEQMGTAIRSLGDPLIGLLDLYAKLVRAAATLATQQERILDTTRRLNAFAPFFGIRIPPADASRAERLKALQEYADSLEDLVARLRSGERPAIVLPPPMVPTPAKPTGGKTAGVPTEEEEERVKTLWDFWQEMPGVMLQLQSDASAAAEHTDRLEQGWARLNQQMEMSPKNAAKLEEQLGRVAQAASMSQQEMLLMNAAAEAGGTIIAGIFGGNIGQLAKWKAQQNAIMAAENLAMAAASALIPGLQGQAAGHIAAAKMFAGVSAAWAALAGATGGFSGSAGGGGAGAPRDVGGSAASTQRAGSEIHIHFVGPGFQAINPEVQRVVYGAIREAEERYGPNARVKIHRRGG